MYLFTYLFNLIHVFICLFIYLFTYCLNNFYCYCSSFYCSPWSPEFSPICSVESSTFFLMPAASPIFLHRPAAYGWAESDWNPCGKRNQGFSRDAVGPLSIDMQSVFLDMEERKNRVGYMIPSELPIALVTAPMRFKELASCLTNFLDFDKSWDCNVMHLAKTHEVSFNWVYQHLVW